MKHKTLFRLQVKVVGILILAFYLPDLVWMLLGTLLAQMLDAGQSQPNWPGNTWFMVYGNLEYLWPSLMQQGPKVLIGFYLLFGGKWIVNKCIPSNRPYCPECGYQLENAAGGICPECGTKLPESI